MPTFPEQESQSQSSSMGCSFTANVPIVTSLSSRELVKQGWEKCGFTWTMGEDCITYDGVTWRHNGIPVMHMEDIKRK